MNLRKRNYPPKFWLQLHKFTTASLLPLAKKRRRPSTIKINSCLTFLSPHVQKFIYTSAIDKRKGEIRSTKLPLSPEQFNVLNYLGLTHKYEPVVLLEQELQLKYNFMYKGYLRGVQNLQFRVQKQKPVVLGQNPILILRIRFHQKAPILNE
jgi:hypothetical protein